MLTKEDIVRARVVLDRASRSPDLFCDKCGKDFYLMPVLNPHVTPEEVEALNAEAHPCLS